MRVIRDQRAISYTMGPKNHHVQIQGGGLPYHMLTITQTGIQSLNSLIHLVLWLFVLFLKEDRWLYAAI